jgi:hypothetical protein
MVQRFGFGGSVCVVWRFPVFGTGMTFSFRE